MIIFGKNDCIYWLVFIAICLNLWLFFFTNLPSLLAEHLDAITSIENFDPMSETYITVIDLKKTNEKKTRKKRTSGLDGIKLIY